MGIADLDLCELHLKVVNYFTSLPYVDSNSGFTTRDLPYELIEVQDDFYEPKKGALSTIKITFPSLYAKPELRPILQKIQEGDRVEVYNFQPDCGDPVIAGYIPPGGFTSDDQGRVVLDLTSTLGRGQWERLRKIETFNTNTAGYMSRLMSAWFDVLNEDFDLTNDPNVAKAYLIVSAGTGQTAFSQGQVLINTNGVSNTYTSTLTPLSAQTPSITLSPGSTFLIEALATPTDGQLAAPANGTTWSLGLVNSNNDTIGANEVMGENTGSQWWDNFGFNINYNGVATYYPNGYQSPNAGVLPTKPGGTQHAYSILLQVQANGTINAYYYLDYLLMTAQTLPAPRSQSGWSPWISATCPGTQASLIVSKWRVRELQPWIAQAPRFNPQNAASYYFQANADDYLTAINNVVELDYSEYRLIYKAAPNKDQLELDAVGSLGTNASNVLGLQQSTNALRASPFGAGVEKGLFTADASSGIMPPFRAEEGYNLAKAPIYNRKQLNHANLIQRLGSGTLDGQNFFETWSVKETGKPQAVNATQNPAPIAALFPYFESVQNDDRTVLPATIQSLALNDLKQSTDTTPSLTVQMLEQLPYAFQYRPGDTIRLRTLSLLNNLDQDMRIMSIRYRSGDPTREIVLGKHENDPSMIALLSMDMQEAWLYSQAGSSPLVIIYPYASQSVAANSVGTDFQFPIDQFTGGTALVSAKVHWFTQDGSAASNFQFAISNSTLQTGVNLGVLVSAQSPSGADSGLVDITSILNATGNYHMAPYNNSGSAHIIGGLFLILKVKIN